VTKQDGLTFGLILETVMVK